ncbi:MAG: hypothetical protein KKB20_01925 [Proteobacteria bacterium]|nr:hypothetical protein [Pseudomonadota bacterium]
MKHLERLTADLRALLYGFLIHGMVSERAARKKELEDVFMLAQFGGLVGLPVFTPYYALRFLPHLAPRLMAFKTGIVKEKDVFEHFQEG